MKKKGQYISSGCTQPSFIDTAADVVYGPTTCFVRCLVTRLFHVIDLLRIPEMNPGIAWIGVAVDARILRLQCRRKRCNGRQPGLFEDSVCRSVSWLNLDTFRLSRTRDIPVLAMNLLPPI